MSTTQAVVPAAAPGSGSVRTVLHLLAAEWTKLRSVRSTVWSLALLVVAVPGFTALFAWVTNDEWNRSTASDHTRILSNPVGAILSSGLYFGQLAVCIL